MWGSEVLNLLPQYNVPYPKRVLMAEGIGQLPGSLDLFTMGDRYLNDWTARCDNSLFGFSFLVSPVWFPHFWFPIVFPLFVFPVCFPLCIEKCAEHRYCTVYLHNVSAYV